MLMCKISIIIIINSEHPRIFLHLLVPNLDSLIRWEDCKNHIRLIPKVSNLGFYAHVLK